MKQYDIMFNGTTIESTGYFPSIAAVRAYLCKRYTSTAGLTFRAVYPTLESEVYDV